MGITTDGQEPPSVPGDDTVDSEAIIDGEVMEQDIANGAVTNGKIANGAVDDAKITGPISISKLDTDPLARANHTGTQLLSTISDAGTMAAESASDYLNKAGGTMTGQIALPGDPLVDADAARKKYVDDSISAIDFTPYLEKTGGTMTGNLVMSGGADIDLGSSSVITNVNQGMQGVNGAPGNIFLNAGTGGVSKFFLRYDGGMRWFNSGTFEMFNDVSGVMRVATGKFQQNAAPTVGDDLTNKTYVDAEVGGRVADTGDTMTGALEIDTTLLGGTTPALDFTYNATGNRAFSIDSLGVHYWADPATGTIDTQLSRAAAGVLALAAGDQLRVLQDPIVDNDVARKKYVDDQITNETAFGDHYEYNRNVASATTTLTTPIERARVDLTGMAAGDYLVVGQAHFSTSNANARIKLQIVQDPDGAPVELDGQITVGPAVSVTGTMYFVAQVTLPAGSESFAVRFWHDSGSGSSTLEESTIYAHRVA